MKNKLKYLLIGFCVINALFCIKQHSVNKQLRKELEHQKNYFYTADALLERSKSLFEMNITGILHIGAHEGEEINLYKKLDVKKVLYVEANPEYYQKLNQKMQKMHGDIFIKTYNFAASEKEEKMPFYITNNGQSSSLLKLKNHKILHPSIHEVNSIMVDAKPVDKAISSDDLKGINTLVLDIQGSELSALKGCTALLEKIDYIVSEVNYVDVYSNSAKINDLDAYLVPYGFVRIDTFSSTKGWGDALYIRKALLAKMFD